ncbi:hypothetical protein H1C71_031416 [Ictidomys tridecemlineatus]|nr:hypothetical protein H1C71_031416 [Ictidomys tridecemlineatus]
MADCSPGGQGPFSCFLCQSGGANGSESRRERSQAEQVTEAARRIGLEYKFLSQMQNPSLPQVPPNTQAMEAGHRNLLDAQQEHNCLPIASQISLRAPNLSPKAQLYGSRRIIVWYHPGPKQLCKNDIAIN